MSDHDWKSRAHLLMCRPGYTRFLARAPLTDASRVRAWMLVNPSCKRTWALIRPAGPFSIIPIGSLRMESVVIVLKQLRVKGGRDAETMLTTGNLSVRTSGYFCRVRTASLRLSGVMNRASFKSQARVWLDKTSDHILACD